jgi:SAM-dependent methyltransferase
MSDLTHLQEPLETFSAAMRTLPDTGFGAEFKLLAAMAVSNTLQQVLRHLDADPLPPLRACLERQTEFLSLPALSPVEKLAAVQPENSVAATRTLYEEAWTVYDRQTYVHSIELIEARLRANGYDEAFFKGKACFDGGCGTGRFALAMKRMGAGHVVGADMGGRSLDFARRMAAELGAGEVEFLEMDATDLSRFPDESFDVVVSNGVLHHAVETERGIREHFRITRGGGLFWLYLYGAGGLYWDLYDHLKELLRGIGPETAKAFMLRLDLRPGAIYTFLDNAFAPIRKYYRNSEITALLGETGLHSATRLRGTGQYDDGELQIAAAYGPLVLGDEGKVRLALVKVPA